MNAPPSFRDARPEDQDRILSLLRAAGLPTADVSLSRQEFIVATVGGEVIACAGLERFGEAGLFRGMDPVAYEFAARPSVAAHMGRAFWPGFLRRPLPFPPVSGGLAAGRGSGAARGRH